MLPGIIAVGNGDYNTGSGNYANEAKWSTALASARAVENCGRGYDVSRIQNKGPIYAILDPFRSFVFYNWS